MTRGFWFLFALAICLAANGRAAAQTQATAEQVALAEQLQPFADLVGRTFRGEFASSTPDKPLVDVSRWERAVNGQAIRILHSVNDGEYGGESILMWDPQQRKIAVWYFTTAGFFTHGTMEVTGSSWTSVEEVSGNGDGIARVKSTSEILPSGELQVRSQYLVNGAWQQGHEIRYQPAPDAQVVFR